jgi:hypothetical protein
MYLRQSVVLWQGKVGIQKIALFGKRPSPYYSNNSSNKQRETTVHHYFKTWRSVNPEKVKNLKVYLSAVAKITKRFDETVSHEDRHRKWKPRVTSAAEDKFIRVNCTSDCSSSGSNTLVTVLWLDLFLHTSTAMPFFAWRSNVRYTSIVTIEQSRPSLKLS